MPGLLDTFVLPYISATVDGACHNLSLTSNEVCHQLVNTPAVYATIEEINESPTIVSVPSHLEYRVHLGSEWRDQSSKGEEVCTLLPRVCARVVSMGVFFF